MAIPPRGDGSGGLDIPTWLETLPIELVLTFVIDAVIRLGLVARIVMRRGSVPVSLAWLVLLLFAPIVGAGLYLMVGEARLGRRRARRHRLVTDRLKPLEARVWREQRWGTWPLESEDEIALSRLATAATGLPPVGGNRVAMFTDEDWMDRLVADVDAATRHVHVLTYIWMVGGAGHRLAQAIVRARGRGVACRVLVDAVGSRSFLRGPDAAAMRAAGAEVVAALPANLLRIPFARIDLRNHRKLAVIDGTIAHAGSHNVTDESFKVRRVAPVGPWIDMTVRIEGPAVLAAQLVFLQDWLLDARRPLELDAELLPEPEPAETPGTVLQLIPSGPGEVPHAIHDMLLATIWSARRELTLTTPYFVPDEATRSALRAAALRGVAVTLVVPGRNDSPLVSLAGNAQLDELLAAGVRVHRHRRGLLHSKTLVADRDLAVVGSANLDMRSFWLNFELTLMVPDSDFASQVAWLQQRDIDESDEVDPQAWAQRPVLRRFVENLVRLGGPLL